MCQGFGATVTGDLQRTKTCAMASMNLYDRMPPDVQELSRKYGVIVRYLMNMGRWVS